MNGVVTIKKGREKPILQGHPWVFSGAIQAAQEANPGAVVTLQTHTGDFLARGYWNPKSQIQVRILTWRDDPIDGDWWRAALTRAIAARQDYSTSCRLVNAENDYLPGLVVDRYVHADGRMWLVLQALTLGIEHRKAQIVETLADLVQPAGIYERSDVDVREREGLSQVKGLLWGLEPPERVVLDESGVRFYADLVDGHKTGTYLDQAENRHFIRTLAREQSVLNLFSYTGGFGLHALHAGAAQVTNVDSSLEALHLADDSATELNSFPAVEHIQADVFQYLREVETTYDLVILDPPKFAHSKSQVERAARGYKDINLNAFKRVQPGGHLLTFSCSGAISADLFQKIVFGALVDSDRQAQILRHLGPSADHPVALTFPEGAYLKGLLLRVY